MESLISDKNAMDPEVTVPVGALCMSGPILQALWSLLSGPFAGAVLVVAGAAFTLLPASASCLGLLAAAFLAAITGCCLQVARSGAGLWLGLLQHCASLAMLAKSLVWSLRLMGGLKFGSLLALQNYHYFSAAVLLFVTLLFILGLERSRLLRIFLWIMLGLIFLQMFFGIILFHNPNPLQRLVTPPLVFKQVVESMAFFHLIYCGTMDRMDIQKSPSPARSSITVLLCTTFGVLYVLIFLLCIVQNEVGPLEPGEISLANAFKYNEVVFHGMKASDIWLGRDGMAVLATLALSLSLVEVMTVAKRAVASMAGYLLPAHVARDNRWTGTQLTAILFPGLVSAFLVVVLSVPDLVRLCSLCCLLSAGSDLVGALYLQYQPSFLPKHSAEELKDGGSYQLISDRSRLVSSDASDSELSDDSGHSSDTDIDEIVQEYKETVRVTAEPSPEPTVSTARRACYSLLAILLTSAAMGLAVSLGFTYLPAFGALEVVFFTLLMSRQPTQTEGKVLSPWLPCLVLCLHIVLATQLLPSSVQISFFIWSASGLILWLGKKRSQWLMLQARFRSRGTKSKIQPQPHLHTVLSFLPSYRTLTSADSLQVLR